MSLVNIIGVAVRRYIAAVVAFLVVAVVAIVAAAAVVTPIAGVVVVVTVVTIVVVVTVVTVVVILVTIVVTVDCHSVVIVAAILRSPPIIKYFCHATKIKFKFQQINYFVLLFFFGFEQIDFLPPKTSAETKREPEYE